MLQRNCRLSKSVWILGLVLLTGPLFSQSSATWSGSAQCQLILQTSGYTHQEVQTWTIAEAQPTQQGAMHVYPATWRASGGGSSQKLKACRFLPCSGTVQSPRRARPSRCLFGPPIIGSLSSSGTRSYARSAASPGCDKSVPAEVRPLNFLWHRTRTSGPFPLLRTSPPASTLTAPARLWFPAA